MPKTRLLIRSVRDEESFIALRPEGSRIEDMNRDVKPR